MPRRKKQEVEKLGPDTYQVRGVFEDEFYDVTVTLSALQMASPESEKMKRFYDHLIETIMKGAHDAEKPEPEPEAGETDLGEGEI